MRTLAPSKITRERRTDEDDLLQRCDGASKKESSFPPEGSSGKHGNFIPPYFFQFSRKVEMGRKTPTLLFWKVVWPRSIYLAESPAAFEKMVGNVSR